MEEPKMITKEEIDNLLLDPIHGRSEITQLELDLLNCISVLREENEQLKKKLAIFDNGVL